LPGDAAGGPPQRFGWLPAVDRAAPDLTPPAPLPRHYDPPDFDPGRITPFSQGLAPAGICENAREVGDHAALARLRGETAALDGHLLLTRLKVAAALALLDGRVDVDDDDWR